MAKEVKTVKIVNDHSVVIAQIPNTHCRTLVLNDNAHYETYKEDGKKPIRIPVVHDGLTIEEGSISLAIHAGYRLIPTDY